MRPVFCMRGSCMAALLAGAILVAPPPAAAWQYSNAVGSVRDPGLVGRSNPSSRIGYVGTARTSSSLLAGYGGGGGAGGADPGPLDISRARADRMGISNPAVTELRQMGNGLNGILLSGFSMTGQNAARIMSAGGPNDPGRTFGYGAHDFFGQRLANGALDMGGRVDRYGMAFGKDFAMPAAPIPPPAARDERLTPLPEVEPVTAPSQDIRDRLHADAMHHMARAVERLFGNPNEVVPSFESVRQAELEFDRVRRALPEDPRAYLWTTILALRMDNLNHAMAVWRQCLSRFEKRRSLDGLRLDFSELALSADVMQRVRDKSPAFLQQLSTNLVVRLGSAPDNVRVSGTSLAATLLWLGDESRLSLAVDSLRQARELEVRSVSPNQRMVGLALLYDLLNDRASRKAAAPNAPVSVAK